MGRRGLTVTLQLRLEIYAVALAVALLFSVGTYFKGRVDERDATQQKQLAANAKQMTDYQVTQQLRDAADDKSRSAALAFVDDISKRMDTVNAKFSKLPSVVVDAHGCEHLTDAARSLWNAVEMVPAGPAIHATEVTSGPMRATDVPAR
jgi:hypothetical protein